MDMQELKENGHSFLLWYSTGALLHQKMFMSSLQVSLNSQP